MPHERWPRSALAGPGLCLLLIGLAGCQSEQAKQEAAYKERYAKAKALFEERCKTAGVVIHRTVKDVEGIELTKVRPKLEWADQRYFDSMWSGAAMAAEHKGDDYIKQFLMTEFPIAERPNERGMLGPRTRERLDWLGAKKGYSFVEFVDSVNKQRYRCTPDWSRDHPNWVDGQHRCIPTQTSAASFSLDFEDLEDSTDREFWVAGTKLKVIDKKTGESIAVLTRFVWDSGFGVSTTGRLPWVHANASGEQQICPHQPGARDDVSRKFVDTVLIPKQGD